MYVYVYICIYIYVCVPPYPLYPISQYILIEYHAWFNTHTISLGDIKSTDVV